MTKSRVVIVASALLLLAAALLGCGVPSSSSGTSGMADDTAAGTSTTRGATSSNAPASSTTASAQFPTTLLTPAHEILRDMTLRQKAAQVLLVSLDGTSISPATRQLLLESPPAGFLLLGPNVTGGPQLRSLTASLQDAAMAGEAQVGLFIAVDQEGGSVQRIRFGVPSVPAARILGDTSSPMKAAEMAVRTAVGLLGLGVNMNLAPVADVVSDPHSFLYWRTYGGDPTVVTDFVEAVTKAYVANGVIVVVKHFPGHGSAAGNTHGSIVVSKAGQADFATIHLPPFKAAFRAGAEGVMMAHVVAAAFDPDRPASLSERVIGDLLREGLGFSGLVVTDDLEMVAGAAAGATEGPGAMLPDDPGELAVMALQAGCDLLISTGTAPRQQAMLDAIVAAVETGTLAADRLDDAVLHVLGVKLRHGLTFP